VSALPLLISLPHAGRWVPPAAAPYCALSAREIAEDGDGGAAEIYGPLEGIAAAFVTTRVARAIVDMNRAEDDFRKDGVIKTHTCFDVPIYREPLPEAAAAELLATYHRPYHDALRAAARRREVRFALDCHTMAAQGPPVGPDPGQERPLICLGNAHGAACSAAHLELLAECFQEAFQVAPAINLPFAGGHITRTHPADGLPWIQIELSRTPNLSDQDKASGVRRALTWFCEGLEVGDGRSLHKKAP
jgi:formiminoglutamase